MSELTSLPAGQLESGCRDKPRNGALGVGETEAQDGVQGGGAPLPLKTMPSPLRLRWRPGPPASGMDTRGECSRSRGAEVAGPGRARRGGHCACSWSPLSPSPHCPHGPRQRPGHLASEKRRVPSRDGGAGGGGHIASLVHLRIWPKFTEQPGSRADSGLTARLGGRVGRCHPGQAAHGGRGRP